MQAAQQCDLVRLGRKGQAFRCHFLGDEGVDGISDREIGNLRDRWPPWSLVGPVFLKNRTLHNPALEQFTLLIGNMTVGIRRWHDLLRIRGKETHDQFAGFWFAGHHDIVCPLTCLDIQLEVLLALVFVLPVTIEAVFR